MRSPICSGQDGLLDAAAAQAQATGDPANPLAPKPQHFPAKAKAVISVFCYGGVSQIDTFDPKPDLMKWQGETMQGVGRCGRSWATPAA